MNIFRRYFYNVFLGIDTLVSAITFGAAGETLSARFARAHDQKHYWVYPFYYLTDIVARVAFGVHEHCDLALKNFNARNAVVPF